MAIYETPRRSKYEVDKVKVVEKRKTPEMDKNDARRSQSLLPIGSNSTGAEETLERGQTSTGSNTDRRSRVVTCADDLVSLLEAQGWYLSAATRKSRLAVASSKPCQSVVCGGSCQRSRVSRSATCGHGKMPWCVEA